MNQNESNNKGKFFQKKTLSEKNKPGGAIHSLQLLKLLGKRESQSLINFIEKDHPSLQVLNEGVTKLIKEYQKGDQEMYGLLNILFSYGASPNISIFNDQIKLNENISILMFAIKNNDIQLVNLVLKYNPEINKPDIYMKIPIIYAIIYNDDDSTDILKLLIQHGANINYSVKIGSVKHSVFTIAIYKNLKNVTKCLIDNNVDVSFKTVPNGDTGLHLAASYAKADLLELLLSYPKIVYYIDVTNNDKKRPFELIKDNEEKNKKINIFNNCYNLFKNIKNQNMKMNYSLTNNNIKNINTQLNKMQQMNQMQMINMNDFNNINNFNFTNFEPLNNNGQMDIKNINNGKRISVNSSPNIGYNYIPPGINMNLGNYTMKNNNMNQLNNFGINNNINNNMIKNMLNSNMSNESNDNSIENDDTNSQRPNNYSIKNNYQEEEKDINKEQNKELMINQQESHNAQMPKMINSNNKKLNIYNINPYKLNQIKNNLYNKIHNNNNINCNLEIPVEFIKHRQIGNNKDNNYNINNFILQNNIPTLFLDLSNPSLSLELKLDELKEKKKELLLNLEELNKEKREISKEKEKSNKIFNQKERDRTFIISQIKVNATKLNELYSNQEKIKNEFPPNILSDKFYKNSESKRIKFEPPILDEVYKIKTLNKDLIDYEKYINHLNFIKKPKIKIILQKLKLSVDEVLPGYEIKMYDAYGSNLNLPWSDINIILTSKNNINNNDKIIGNSLTEAEIITSEKSIQSDNEINSNMTNAESFLPDIYNNLDSQLLENLSNSIKKSNWINKEQKIIIQENESINYLITTTNEEYEKIKIYISIERPNHPGLKRLELIKSYIKEYPPLRPIILALEKILKSANLNNQYPGGLSFYGLILMVVSFIQNQKENNNYTFKEENIKGKIFYEFLKYYGIKFDFNKYVIMTYKINEINTPLTEKENQFIFGPNPNIKELTILDPLDKKTNVVKNTYQFMNIKMAFFIAFNVTQEDCECGCHFGKAYFEHNYITVEHCYLKRMFNSVIRFNDQEK